MWHVLNVQKVLSMFRKLLQSACSNVITLTPPMMGAAMVGFRAENIFAKKFFLNWFHFPVWPVADGGEGVGEL